MTVILLLVRDTSNVLGCYVCQSVFRRCNKCTQVYSTGFDWARVHPVASRIESHETFSLLFAKDCIQQDYVCDNAKVTIQGKCSKFNDAACQLKKLEPYIPVYREIKELKKGTVKSCFHPVHQCTCVTTV